MTATKTLIQPIEKVIESTTINKRVNSLAAPVHLKGALNCAKLVAENFRLYPLQIGVDEAGRGPLLGSVTIAATLLPTAYSDLIENQPLINTPLAILTDSKKLSEKKREQIFPLIKQLSIAYIVADIPAAVIDQLNIFQATLLGMRLCTEQLLIAINHAFKTNDKNCLNFENNLKAQILFDGNKCPDLDYFTLKHHGIDEVDIACQAWIKGDARHTSIAAASILAKVNRDQTMYDLHAKHSQYGIDKHKGYPTKAHLQALDKYGVLTEHRRSFAPVAKRLAKST